MNRRTSALALLSVCFYLIAVANDRAALYVLCWLTVSLGLVCFAISRLALAGLELQRAPLPDRLVAGEQLPLRYRVANLGSLPKADLLLDDQLENLTTGQVTRRPALLAWLNGESRLTVEAEPYIVSRGRIRVGPLTVTAGDPVGLFERAMTVGDRREVLVHPRLVDLPALGMPAIERGESPAALRTTTGHDLRGVRPYQFGDDLRFVDWKQTAHLDVLHVREFEQPRSQSALVVLDLCREQVFGSGVWSSLETAVSAAASLLRRLDQDGRTAALLAHEQNQLTWPGNGRTDLLGVLDLLSEVTGEGQVPLASLVESQAEAWSEARLLVAITADTRTAALDALRRTARRGSALLVVVVDGARMEPNLLHLQPIEGDGEQWLSPEAFAANLRQAGAHVAVIGPDLPLDRALAGGQAQPEVRL